MGISKNINFHRWLKKSAKKSKYFNVILQKKLVIFQKISSFVTENQLNGSHNVE
jgi:hypothetical protein